MLNTSAPLFLFLLLQLCLQRVLHQPQAAHFSDLRHHVLLLHLDLHRIPLPARLHSIFFYLLNFLTWGCPRCFTRFYVSCKGVKLTVVEIFWYFFHESAFFIFPLLLWSAQLYHFSISSHLFLPYLIAWADSLQVGFCAIIGSFNLLMIHFVSSVGVEEGLRFF